MIGKIESAISTDIQIVTVPIVSMNCNSDIKEMQKKEFDNLKTYLVNGYKISHSTSACMNDVMFVNYVLEKGGH
jgi:hypothetical protein